MVGRFGYHFTALTRSVGGNINSMPAIQSVTQTRAHPESLGRAIRIEPFCEKHFSAFGGFYDRKDPQWDPSVESRASSDQHDTSVETLSEIAERVNSREDARFVILTDGHVIGYLDIEEIGSIKAGKKTFLGDDHYAQLGIAISDRFQRMRLGSFALFFLKYVSAVAVVGLGLITDPEKHRGFFSRHGFVEAGQKSIYSYQTGEWSRSPWYVLENNELC